MNEYIGEMEDSERLEENTDKLLDFLNECKFKHPLETLIVLHAVQQAVVISLYDHLTKNEDDPDDDQAGEQEGQGRTNLQIIPEEDR